MSAFVASKFDPLKDPDRPKVGDTIKYGGHDFAICKVAWASPRQLMQDESLMERGDYTVCVARDHVSRPGVVWLVWANAKETDAQKTE